MALTQADLDRLDHAIATSELEVEIDGTRVRYRDTDSLIKARAHVASVVAGSAAASTSTGATYYPVHILGRER